MQQLNLPSKNQGEKILDLDYTLVPMLHFQQMMVFTIGAGVEFYPKTDLDDIRKDFIDNLSDRIELNTKIPDMLREMMLSGSVLLWLRPNGREYEIRHFPKNRYRIYENTFGDKESVEIIYSYKKRQSLLPNGLNKNLMWVKIRITKDSYEIWESEAEPNLDGTTTKSPNSSKNTLGFIPVKECPNVDCIGERGKGEFERLEGRIRRHDELSSGIVENLLDIASNPFLTSMEKEDIFDSESTDWKGVAYAAGYRGVEDLTMANYGGAPIRKKRHKLKKFIGGFDPQQGDFLQQATVYPLPPNQLTYVEDFERKLRGALGGNDERGLETATEVQLVYAKSMMAANKKQLSLLKYGLCEIFSMAILAEESLYLASGGNLGLPTGTFDLDRQINFRVMPATPRSARDRLNEDIVGRNMARKGVSQLAVLRNTFPDKSDQELKAMLVGGVPTQYLQDVTSALMSLQSIIEPSTGLPLTAFVDSVSLIKEIFKYAGQPGSEYVDYDTSGATANLESDALDAARDTSAYLGFRDGSDRLPADGSGNRSDSLPRESEQPFPRPGATVNFWRRNFPTFSSAIDRIRGVEQPRAD